jgi:hypothetical protein
MVFFFVIAAIKILVEQLGSVCWGVCWSLDAMLGLNMLYITVRARRRTRYL